MATKPKSYPAYHAYVDERGEWRWTYFAKNGEAIAVSSEGYKEKRDCDHGIELMKASSSSPVS